MEPAIAERSELDAAVDKMIEKLDRLDLTRKRNDQNLLADDDDILDLRIPAWATPSSTSLDIDLRTNYQRASLPPTPRLELGPFDFPYRLPPTSLPRSDSSTTIPTSGTTTPTSRKPTTPGTAATLMKNPFRAIAQGFAPRPIPAVGVTVGGVALAQRLPPEILVIIFGYLRAKRDFVSCALVSVRWRECAKRAWKCYVKSRPYVGMGLVRALRLRFSTVTIPPPTISSFDRMVWQLAKDYCRSNPGTWRAFGPCTENPVDLLYDLFWTLLFIDQEFRNPRIRRKVSCSYFVRLVRSEGGYPRNVFGKRVLKIIYNDIRQTPLLPPPYCLRAGYVDANITTTLAPGAPDTSTTPATVPTPGTTLTAAAPPPLTATPRRFDDLHAWLRRMWRRVGDTSTSFDQQGWPRFQCREDEVGNRAAGGAGAAVVVARDEGWDWDAWGEEGEAEIERELEATGSESSVVEEGSEGV